MITKHLIIKGRVQGVSYRAWFSELARSMNLKGWVRNRVDGTVEAVIQGKPDDLDAIVNAAQIGPTLADVKEVVANNTDQEAPQGVFEIRATQ